MGPLEAPQLVGERLAKGRAPPGEERGPVETLEREVRKRHVRVLHQSERVGGGVDQHSRPGCSAGNVVENGHVPLATAGTEGCGTRGDDPGFSALGTDWMKVISEVRSGELEQPTAPAARDDER